MIYSKHYPKHKPITTILYTNMMPILEQVHNSFVFLIDQSVVVHYSDKKKSVQSFIFKIGNHRLQRLLSENVLNNY